MDSTRHGRSGHGQRGRFFALLALLAALAVAGWMPDAAVAAKRKAPKKSAEAEQDVLRYLPDGCQVLGWIDVAALRRSEAGRKVVASTGGTFEKSFRDLAPFGVGTEQVDRIVFGIRPVDGGKTSQSATAIRCTQSVRAPDKNAAPGKPAWTAEKVGRQTVWVSGGAKPSAVWIAEERVVVCGEPETLRSVARRDAPAKLPPTIDRARRLLRPSSTVGVTCIPSALAPNDEPYTLGLPPNILEHIDALNFEADLDADLQLRAAAVCRDEAGAQLIKQMADGLWALVLLQPLEDQEPEMREVIRSIKFERKGSAFNASMKIPGALIEEASDVAPPAGPSTLPTEWVAPPTAPGAAAPPGASRPCVTPPSYGPPTAHYTTPPASTLTPCVPGPPCPAAPYPVPSSVPPYDPYATPPYYPVMPAARPGVICCPATPGAGPADPFMGRTPVPGLRAAPLATLELADVIRLVEAGVDDLVIERHLQNRRLAAPLETDDLILLTKSGASKEVILVLQAMPVAPQPVHDNVREKAAEGWVDPFGPGGQSNGPAGPSKTAMTEPGPVVPASAEVPVDDKAGEPLAIAASRVAKKVQMVFTGPEGARVRWDVRRRGAFDSRPLVCPGQHEFPKGAIYALKVEAIPGKPQLTLYPTLEIVPGSEKTAALLEHNAVPVGLTGDDIEQLLKGTRVTKVVYLPYPEFQELALSGVETLVSSRLEPGADPIVEANRRGTVLAILQVDGQFLAPAWQRHQESLSPTRFAPQEPWLLPGIPRAGAPLGLPPATPCPVPGAEGAGSRPSQELRFKSENLRRMLDEWERIWSLDQPDQRATYRTHGGCI